MKNQRLYDLLKHHAPPEIKQYWDNCPLFVADNVLQMIDENPDYSFWKDNGDFLLAHPYQDFCVEGQSSGITWCIKAEVVEPDVARQSGIPVPDDTWRLYALQVYEQSDHFNNRQPFTCPGHGFGGCPNMNIHLITGRPCPGKNPNKGASPSLPA